MSTSAAARGRTVMATALCMAAGALLLPLGFRVLLPASQRLEWVLFLGYFGGAVLVTLVTALSAWVALWPATPYLDLRPGDAEPRGAEPREAKVATLAYPARVATAATATGELLTVAGWLTLTVSGEPPGLVLGLSLTTALLVALSWLLIYALSQRAVAPLMLRLREVYLSKGELLSGVTLRGRLAYAVAVVICAGVLPAGVFAGAFLDRSYTETAAAQRRQTATWLGQVVKTMEPKDAAHFLATVPLTDGFPTTTPTKVLPGEFVELPSGKEPLRYYVPGSPPARPPLGLLLAVAGLIFLGLLLAVGGGVLVSRDVVDLSALVDRDADTQVHHPSQAMHHRDPLSLTTEEARQVETALLRLSDRMRRLHVDSYLAIERIVDARRAKSQFLASMSHDLRSPLSSVLGFAELLSSGYEGNIPEAAHRRLLNIHRTGRRLLRLLSEILDTAKVESQTIELHPRRCAAAELIAQAVAEARRGRLSDETPVVVEIQQGLPPLFVDPMRFPQALAHLIGHVLDGAGTQPSGPESSAHRLRISAKSQVGNLGEGGSQTESTGALLAVEVAVEPTTAHENAESTPQSLYVGTVGLGLALPLARRLIALHGGEIEVGSGPRSAVIALVPLRAAVPT